MPSENDNQQNSSAPNVFGVARTDLEEALANHVINSWNFEDICESARESLTHGYADMALSDFLVEVTRLAPHLRTDADFVLLQSNQPIENTDTQAEDTDVKHASISREAMVQHLLNDWAAADSKRTHSELLDLIDEMRTDGRAGFSSMTHRELVNEIECLGGLTEEEWSGLEQETIKNLEKVSVRPSSRNV